jgi:hypothetical protein
MPSNIEMEPTLPTVRADHVAAKRGSFRALASLDCRKEPR